MYVKFRGELRLSRTHTLTEYEMSGEPYSQESGLINHSNVQIFQVMTPSVRHIVILPHIEGFLSDELHI